MQAFTRTASFKTVSFKVLYHNGTMNPKDKKLDSLEGGGLSVTTHPDEWAQITPLGGELWELTKSGNRFLDAHSLTDKNEDEVIAWGVENGYIESKTIYRVPVYDEEGELWYFDFKSYNEALIEATEESEIVVKDGGLIPTPKLSKATGVRSSIAEAFNHLLTVYAETVTSYDGVWWGDDLDVGKLSAPRGVIFKDKLSEWNKESI